MNEEKIIMYDSPEAATYVTNIEGWIDKDRRFFGKGEQGEHMARCSSCTHLRCDCGGITDRGWTKCDECRHKAAAERYNALPFKEWSDEPVVTWDGDRYFFNEEDLIDYLKDNEMKSIDLLFCEENSYYHINSDYWEDVLPEDGEIPKELENALKEINKVISSLPPASYLPGKIRTTYRI